MRLRLKNFRCYTDKEFDFGNEGMLLLSGPSGSGKSTILHAINFVLYGTGTKLQTFGKTSCEVCLEFDDLKIVRTKRPNRVVVTNTTTNEEYEDNAGQGVINEKFGTAFDITSYVQQNAYKSFIMMSPMDKLAFLERFAFQGIDLVAIKGRCQSNIKKRNEELLQTVSQLEMATSHLESIEKPKKVDFPLKSKKDKEKSIKNERIRSKNCTVKISKLEKSIKTLTKERNDLDVFLEKNEIHQQEVEKICERMKKLQSDLEKVSYEGDNTLEDYEEQLAILMKQRELEVVKEKYSQDKLQLEEMETKEIENMSSEIKRLKGTLWKEYTESELKETIEEYKQILSDSEKISRLKSRLKDIEVDEEELKSDKKNLEESRKRLTELKDKLSKLTLQQELYTCPSCNASLRFQNDQLHLHDSSFSEDDEDDIESVKKEITKMNRIINRLEYTVPEREGNLKRYNDLKEKIEKIASQYEEEIPDKTELEDDINHFQEYKRTQYELEKKVKTLEKNVQERNFSHTFQNMHKNLQKQKEKLKSLKKKFQDCDEIENDEDELREFIQEERQKKDRFHNLKKNISQMEKDLENYRKKLVKNENEYIEKYEEIRDLDELSFKLSEKENELQQLKKQYETHQENLQMVEKYLKYVEEKKRYKTWSEKVKELKKEVKEKRHAYAGATMLKEKILQAESIAILNVIESINAHAHNYLDLFFPSDPITVRLLPFKQTKKSTKPQINLHIDYKEMEADIGMLSGGELARVILAFTLSLAEIFNSPMVLLDECTASIDQDLTGVVIDGIRQNFGNKIVIVIAHQVVSGIFDRIIKLS